MTTYLTSDEYFQLLNRVDIRWLSKLTKAIVLKIGSKLWLIKNCSNYETLREKGLELLECSPGASLLLLWNSSTSGRGTVEFSLAKISKRGRQVVQAKVAKVHTILVQAQSAAHSAAAHLLRVARTCTCVSAAHIY